MLGERGEGPPLPVMVKLNRRCQARLERLVAKLELSRSEVLRMGLRALAEQENVDEQQNREDR